MWSFVEKASKSPPSRWCAVPQSSHRWDKTSLARRCVVGDVAGKEALPRH